MGTYNNMIRSAVWATTKNNQLNSVLAQYLCGLLNNCMNFNKKKKRLTPAQFRINCLEKWDSKSTDALLKASGLNPKTFSVIHVDLARAQIAVKELYLHFGRYLGPDELDVIRKFNKRMALEKYPSELSGKMAYPILNLATKIKRRAHKDQELIKKKIQAARYNQPQ